MSYYVNDFGERDEYIYTIKLTNMINALLPDQDGLDYFNGAEIEVYVKLMQVYRRLEDMKQGVRS